MAIDAKTCEEIRKLTQVMWAKKAKDDGEFRRLVGRKKERGHSMADFVDDCTTSLLKSQFVTRSLGPRSMGDVWLKSGGGGIFNPINVKTGIVGANGQPNLVSLKRVLRALLADQIDSYYLLFVKFELVEKSDPKPKVLIVDLLDHLEWTTYNDGPGQMMLLEKKFFEEMEKGYSVTPKPIVDKIGNLLKMLKAGNERLVQARRRTISTFDKALGAYIAKSDHKIDQSALGFVDEPN